MCRFSPLSQLISPSGAHIRRFLPTASQARYRVQPVVLNRAAPSVFTLLFIGLRRVHLSTSRYSKYLPYLVIGISVQDVSMRTSLTLQHHPQHLGIEASNVKALALRSATDNKCTRQILRFGEVELS
jgi:hypothetical protein